MQKLSVPDAKAELELLMKDNSKSPSEISRSIQIILDCVWLQAYEEGTKRLYG